MPGRSFDDFDEYARDYRSIHSANVKISGANSHYFADHKVQELKKLESPGQLQVLDLGCGDGVTEYYFLQHLPLWKISGIDISAQSIREAGNKDLPNARFELYDGELIPFPDKHFDIVFIAAVLHHMDFSLHKTLLDEIGRVLKPGGRLYLFEHNPLNPVTRYLVKSCVFDKDAKLLSYQYSNKLLKKAGFHQIKRKFILFFPRNKIFARLIRLEDKLGWLPLGGQYMYRAIK